MRPTGGYGTWSPHGAIGALEQVIISSRDPEPPPLSYVRVSGGLFRDMMIHDFDLARFVLAEEPVSITAIGSVHVTPEIAALGDVDTAMVLMTTASGVQCHINCSRRAVYGYDQRLEAHGSAGMARSENHSARPGPALHGGQRRRPRAAAALLHRALRRGLPRRAGGLRRRGADRPRTVGDVRGRPPRTGAGGGGHAVAGGRRHGAGSGLTGRAIQGIIVA